ncbi:MAG: OadG family transporter subunit [Cyclobacteriaceae bacterium]
MSESINTALMLMGVGMITVFVVLTLVVVVGNGLTIFVNKFVPEKVVQEVKRTTSGAINPKKLAAITSAVEIFTQGKGKITRIEKID